eukprot:TRINITY_DN3461_c0_g6_i1.p1 TRINITY_DN3461_c0_g6~~TRINITY_DN3461_c0_g6_i1.p1  ORF type:complete len:798 (-),score=113.89 TRINITY_DN3461_c0_g6_i1:61-2454(-)
MEAALYVDQSWNLETRLQAREQENIGRESPIFTSGLDKRLVPRINLGSINSFLVEKLVLIQALIRGRIDRSKYKKLSSNCIQRDYVAREILATERIYVNNLMTLKKTFMDPLMQSVQTGNPIITLDQIKTIFSCLEVIIGYNEQLLLELEARIEDRWSHHQCLGDIFIRLNHYMKTYTQYIKDYNKSINMISQCKSNNQKFVEFLQKVQQDKKEKKLPLNSYLILPVQRIPRYELLLRELIKHTPKFHLDYQNLVTAYECMQKVALYMDDKKKESENIQKVLEIQSSLVGDAPVLTLPHRQFVREGALLQYPKKKERNIYLFNDVLVITKRLVKSSIRKPTNPKRPALPEYKFLSLISLCKFQFNDLPDSNEYLYCIELVEEITFQPLLVLAATSTQEKTSWLTTLMQLKAIMGKSLSSSGSVTDRNSLYNSAKMNSLQRFVSPRLLRHSPSLPSFTSPFSSPTTQSTPVSPHGTASPSLLQQFSKEQLTPSQHQQQQDKNYSSASLGRRRGLSFLMGNFTNRERSSREEASEPTTPKRVVYISGSESDEEEEVVRTVEKGETLLQGDSVPQPLSEDVLKMLRALQAHFATVNENGSTDTETEAELTPGNITPALVTPASTSPPTHSPPPTPPHRQPLNEPFFAPTRSVGPQHFHKPVVGVSSLKGSSRIPASDRPKTANAKVSISPPEDKTARPVPPSKTKQLAEKLFSSAEITKASLVGQKLKMEAKGDMSIIQKFEERNRKIAQQNQPNTGYGLRSRRGAQPKQTKDEEYEWEEEGYEEGENDEWEYEYEEVEE